MKNLREFWEKEWRTHPRLVSSTRYKMINFGYQETMLDVGCGSLAFPDLMIDRSKYLIGCDISVRALKRAKPNIKWFKKKIDLIQCSATNLPFKENVFDRVVCLETLSLMGKDYEDAFKEMCDATKNYLSFNVTHHDSCPDSESFDVVSFNREELEDLLKKLNLEIVEMYEFTRDECKNFGLPIHEQTYSAKGDAKMTIVATAKKVYPTSS